MFLDYLVKMVAFLGYEYLTYEEYFEEKSLNIFNLLFILLINNPFVYKLLKLIKKFRIKFFLIYYLKNFSTTIT